MKRNFLIRFSVSVLVGIIFSSSSALAHQPRINTGQLTTVAEPEISKAYFGKLTGDNHIYKINSDKPFNLYVGVLVPDAEGQKNDVSAAVIKDGDTESPYAVLDATKSDWRPFFEEFARDDYRWGPEFRAEVPAGSYDILVWSSNNDSKYSLAIGEIEAFDFKEGWNAIKLLPEIKKEFFGKSPAGFILSPFGYGFVIFMFLLAGLFGLVYRWLLKKFASGTPYGAARNIGRADKIFRVVLGVALFLLAIYTSWSPWLLFFSGFLFFEAIFSWCGFYAALGRNTCPM